MSDCPQIPDSLRRLMAEIGPRWGEDVPGNVRLMVERFSAVLTDAPRDGVEVSRDIAYGEDARQCLDIFRPARANDATPVLMFVHGGAFVDGERNRSAEVYANVLYYFARHGVLGMNVEYRLAPACQYPAGSDDMRLAVQWARQHAGELGADPGRIFLMAHSAGAAHAASYAYDRRHQPAAGPGLAGLIVVSGRVRADNLPENPNARKVEAYYGTDAAFMDDCSPVAHVGAHSIPTMVAFAEFENPLIDVYCAELVYRLAQAKRRAPPVLRLAGHNHTSMVAHFNTAEERLGREILEFIAHVR